MGPIRAIRPRKWTMGILAVTASLILLSPCALAGDSYIRESYDVPQEGRGVTRFIDGTNAMNWGVEDVPEVEVGGYTEDVRITYPPEALEKVRISEDRIHTRILATVFGGGVTPGRGHVGDDPIFPDMFPSYRRGWKVGEAGGIQIGLDAGLVGFFVECSFCVFPSKGQTPHWTGGWYRYSDIRIFTFSPGFKLQFQNWMKYLYAGDAEWEVSWFDYLLHSFPYVKFGVGPIITDRLEISSDTSPKQNYWDRGLSYTFFITFGLEWRPFGRLVSGFFEAGVQAYVFTTETALSRSPDWMTAFPVRVGVSVSF
ncbi:MAG: hypothetical protein ACYTHM_22220 [Planctomycetota bacterium]